MRVYYVYRFLIRFNIIQINNKINIRTEAVSYYELKYKSVLNLTHQSHLDSKLSLKYLAKCFLQLFFLGLLTFYYSELERIYLIFGDTFLILLCLGDRTVSFYP
jgi:hypothetical protein